MTQHVRNPLGHTAFACGGSPRSASRRCRRSCAAAMTVVAAGALRASRCGSGCGAARLASHEATSSSSRVGQGPPPPATIEASRSCHDEGQCMQQDRLSLGLGGLAHLALTWGGGADAWRNVATYSPFSSSWNSNSWCIMKSRYLHQHPTQRPSLPRTVRKDRVALTARAPQGEGETEPPALPRHHAAPSHP